jgi:hypothetical protein
MLSTPSTAAQCTQRAIYRPFITGFGLLRSSLHAWSYSQNPEPILATTAFFLPYLRVLLSSSLVVSIEDRDEDRTGDIQFGKLAFGRNPSSVAKEAG